MGVANRDIELFNLYTKEQCNEMIEWFHSEEDKGNTLSQTYDTVEDVPDYVNGNRVPPYARVRYIKSEARSYKFAEAYFPTDHKFCVEQLNKVKEHGKKNGVEIKSMIGLVIQRYLTGGEVAWHTDKSPLLVDGQWQQMIYSSSCQLGDDYEGGELVFGKDALGREKIKDIQVVPEYANQYENHWNTIIPFFTASKEVGHGLLYTSSRWHRTQVITKGIRYSLLGWFNGIEDITSIPPSAVHNEMKDNWI